MEELRKSPLIDFLNDVASDLAKLDRFVDPRTREALLVDYPGLSDDHRRWLLEENVTELRKAAQGERAAAAEAAGFGAGEYWLSSPLRRPIN